MYSVGPSSTEWSELGLSPPFPPMRVLEVYWSRALSLVWSGPYYAAFLSGISMLNRFIKLIAFLCSYLDEIFTSFCTEKLGCAHRRALYNQVSITMFLTIIIFLRIMIHLKMLVDSYAKKLHDQSYATWYWQCFVVPVTFLNASCKHA